MGLVACLVLFLWGLGSVRQRVLELTWAPIYLPLGLFFLLGLVQYLHRITAERSETRQALVLLAADLVLFFVTMQLFSTATREAWRGFGLTAVVLTGSLGLFAILQFAAGEQRIYGEVDTPFNLLFGPYVNPNHFAGLMEMLIPVSVLFIAERRRRPSLAASAWLAVAAAVGVGSLLLSGSRGGLLAVITEALIALALVPGLRARRGGARGLAGIVASTILAAVLLFTWVDPGIVSQKLGLIVDAGGPAWSEWAEFRKIVAADSLRMLRDHPVTGVGLGSFETAYPRYQSLPSDLWIDYAHNDYVQAAAETGLLGGLCILWALAFFLRTVFSKGRSSGTDRHEIVNDDEDAEDGALVATDSPPFTGVGYGHWIQLGAALGCCGMLVHSFFDFNLHIPANAAWFAVLAGMACCGRR
jgi:O-antigen ligase